MANGLETEVSLTPSEDSDGGEWWRNQPKGFLPLGLMLGGAAVGIPAGLSTAAVTDRIAEHYGAKSVVSVPSEKLSDPFPHLGNNAEGAAIFSPVLVLGAVGLAIGMRIDSRRRNS